MPRNQGCLSRFYLDVDRADVLGTGKNLRRIHLAHAEGLGV